MSDDPTSKIDRCLEQLQSGDAVARDELIGFACARLKRLTQQMFRGFERLKRWEDADDVLQNAVLRLCKALKHVTPLTARDFFRLAAAMIRRELIDLSRHYYGPEGLGARHATPVSGGSVDSAVEGQQNPGDSTLDPHRLTIWTELHQRVEALSEGDRDVFDLLWYQGLTQPEAARILGIPQRTLKRRWQALRLQLHDYLHDGMAGS